VYSIDVKALADVLRDIKAVAKTKDLKFHTENIVNDKSGARVRIMYVKPQNNILYATMMLPGDTPIGVKSVIEEEVVLEITKVSKEWKANWSWIKHLTEDKHKEKSVINSAVLDIEVALKGTD